MKPHQFQSITEEQWKSGLSRHRCALCSHDYGDPVHCESSWPVVVVIEDCFIPESARLVLEVVSDLDDSACAATWKIAAIYADTSLIPEKWN